jgi:hypothetical protein
MLANASMSAGAKESRVVTMKALFDQGLYSGMPLASAFFCRLYAYASSALAAFKLARP